MNELVIQGGNGQDVTTSQIVAQVFGKRHSDVLRDVRNLKCSDDFRKRNFALMVEMKELPQGGAQKSEFYEMTKDGFSFLVMGYTGAKAGQFKEQFIAEFNKREMMLKSDDYILMRSQQILQKRIELAEQKVKQLEADNETKRKRIEQQTETIEQQNVTIKEQAPKVNYYDQTLQSVNTLTTTQVAKEIGLDASKLNRKMNEAGVIFRQSGQWLLRQPYSSWNLSATRTQTYTRSDGTTGTSTYTVWNERGRRFIHALHESGYNARAAVKMIKSAE